MEPLGKILRETRGNGTHVPRPGVPAENPDVLVDPECPFCNGAGYVRADLAPDQPNFGRPILCVCQIERFETHRKDLLREQSLLGPLSRKTFTTLRPDGRRGQNPANYARVVEQARAYAENPHGWLILAGIPGCGKTHIAAAIANEVVDRGDPVLFQITADLLDHLRATFGPTSETSYDELFEQVCTAPLLVLDDLIGYNGSPWAQEKLFQIINRRFNAELPTVFTLSTELSTLDDRYRARLLDPELATVINVEEEQSPLYQRSGAMGLELLKGMTFEAFDSRRSEIDVEQRAVLQAAFETARVFAEKPSGWLVFTGSWGVGKTHLAAAIANARLTAGRPVFFAIVPDLLDYLRSTFAPESRVTYDELFETIRSSELLILDDIGAHSNSPWAEEKLYQLVNYRYNAKLPTVFTTNFTPDDLDPRLNSRMVDKQLSTLFPMQLPDFRADGVPRRDVRRGQGRKR